jgi:hypothetical protein
MREEWGMEGREEDEGSYYWEEQNGERVRECAEWVDL